MMNGDATFVAPATPFGNSGIAVVRVNGPLALSILSNYLRVLNLNLEALHLPKYTMEMVN